LKYLEPDFASEFGSAVREYALTIGKKNFFTFGEVYDQEEKIARFIGRNGNADGDLISVVPAIRIGFHNRVIVLPGCSRKYPANDRKTRILSLASFAVSAYIRHRHPGRVSTGNGAAN
jgi:hypothetical protein